MINDIRPMDIRFSKLDLREESGSQLQMQHEQIVDSFQLDGIQAITPVVTQVKNMNEFIANTLPLSLLS